MYAPHCSPPPPDLPPDDVFREIFLRLPPDPSFLLAASFVCPATRISPPPGFQDWVLDCCHGRVLLYSYSDRELLVWDPMIADTHYVGAPPDLVSEDVGAALVCAADHVDHTDCHSSPFQIIFLDCKEDDQYWVSACVYSSETEVWGSCGAITTPSLVSSDSSALVGNSVYWKISFAEEDSNHILEFELHSQRLGLIDLPEGVKENYMSDIHIMPAEDGGIGFAGVSYSSIHFWSRRIDSEGVAGWALLRIIDMDKLILSGVPAGDMFLWSSVVAFARDSDVLFLQAEGGIFMIKIRSMQLRKVLEASGSAIYPYASFYTRGGDIVGIDDRDD